MNFIEPKIGELCALTIPAYMGVTPVNNNGALIIIGLSMLALIIILYKTFKYIQTKISQQLKQQLL